MRAFASMAWNGFREARRNRVTIVVGAFLGLLLLSSTLVTEVTVNTFDRVLTDFGLGVMSLILIFLAIFLSCGLLSREIERRTIYLVVGKPISRAQFLLARVAGNMLTLGVLLLAMTLVFFSQLKMFGSPIRGVHLAALLGLYIELLLLTSVGVLMSSFAGTMVSAVATVGLYLTGHLIPDIYELATRTDSAFIRGLGKTVYYSLPNLDRLNFRPQASYGVAVEASSLLTATGYGLAWSGLFLAVAVVIFNRRDFK